MLVQQKTTSNLTPPPHPTGEKRDESKRVFLCDTSFLLKQQNNLCALDRWSKKENLDEKKQDRDLFFWHSVNESIDHSRSCTVLFSLFYIVNIYYK